MLDRREIRVRISAAPPKHSEKKGKMGKMEKMTYEQMNNLFPCVQRENSNGEVEDHHDFAVSNKLQICARCGLKRTDITQTVSVGTTEVSVDATDYNCVTPPEFITVSYRISRKRIPVYIDLQNKFRGSAEQHAMALLERFADLKANERFCIVNELDKGYYVIAFD